MSEAQRILTRRLNERGTGFGRSRHGNPVFKGPSLEQFCAQQLERIERCTDRQVLHVREVRRRLMEKALKREGEELVISVRGCIGSDAHPDDDADIVSLV